MEVSFYLKRFYQTEMSSCFILVCRFILQAVSQGAQYRYKLPPKTICTSAYSVPQTMIPNSKEGVRGSVASGGYHVQLDILDSLFE